MWLACQGRGCMHPVARGHPLRATHSRDGGGTIGSVTMSKQAVARARRMPGALAFIDSMDREQRSGAALLAGGLAYRLFFWLVAFGLVVAAAASFWVESSEGSLVDAGKSFGLSGVAAQSAATAVKSGAHARWYFLGAGLILLVYFGIGAVRALRVAAVIAWQLEPRRLRRPLRASAAFTGIFVLGLTTTMIVSWIRSHAPGLGVLATAGAGAAFLALALLAFRLLPRPEHLPAKAELPGAVLVGCGLTGIHLFVVYYLSDKLERSPKLYGALGASTVVLVGLFLVARVLVAALFLNATLHERRRPWFTPSG